MTNGNSDTVVHLNETEQEICNKLAEERYANNREANIKDRKIGPQTTKETDLDGIGAEFAVAKVLNIYPDLSIKPRKGGVELVARNHARIDVKQTRHKKGHLLAVITKKKGETDVFILVTGQMPEYRIKGWCFEKELLMKENIVDLGYGDTFGLPQHQLREFSKSFIFRQILNETRDWKTLTV